MTGYDQLATDLGIDLSNPMDALARDLVAADHRFLDRLIERRQQANLSEADVAELMGCTEDEVKEFEVFTADPPLSQIRRYAIAIGAKYSHDVESPAGTPPMTRTVDVPRWRVSLEGDPVQPEGDVIESIATRLPRFWSIGRPPIAPSTDALIRAVLAHNADSLGWSALRPPNILSNPVGLRFLYATNTANWCKVLWAHGDRTREPAPEGAAVGPPAAIVTGSRHVRAEAGSAT